MTTTMTTTTRARPAVQRRRRPRRRARRTMTTANTAEAAADKAAPIRPRRGQDEDLRRASQGQRGRVRGQAEREALYRQQQGRLDDRRERRRRHWRLGHDVGICSSTVPRLAGPTRRRTASSMRPRRSTGRDVHPAGHAVGRQQVDGRGPRARRVQHQSIGGHDRDRWRPALSRWARSCYLGGRARTTYAGSKTVGGGIVYNMTQSTGFTIHDINLARGLAAYDFQRPSGMMLIGHLGLRYRAYLVDGYQQRDHANPAKIPQETLAAPTIGAALAIPMLGAKVRPANLGFDAILFGSSVSQTAGLEDGATPSMKDIELNARLHVSLAARLQHRRGLRSHRLRQLRFRCPEVAIDARPHRNRHDADRHPSHGDGRPQRWASSDATAAYSAAS